MATSHLETLTAATVKTFSIAAPVGASTTATNIYATENYEVENYFLSVEVVNVDGTAAVYFTKDGSVPTVGGDDTYVIPAVVGSSILVGLGRCQDITVKAISSGTPQVMVRGV